MSTKPLKEKKSFWKKIGLGKSKSSISSIKSEMQQQEHFESQSMKSKRFSAASINQLKSTEKKQEPTPPLPKPVQPSSLNISQHAEIATKAADHVKQPVLSSDSTQPSLFNTEPLQPTLSKPVISPEPVQSSLSKASEPNPERQSTTIEKLPAPSSPVILSSSSPSTSPIASEIDMTTSIATADNENNKKNVLMSDDTNKTEALSSSYVIVSETKEELLSKVADLQAELESQRATVDALQKQKEAVAKDVDYLELTVEELFSEKTDLLQQLEDEKIKSQHHLDDLNLLLDKMKSNADHARDQSLAVSKSKQEFEAYQKKTDTEREELLNQLKLKDQRIQELEHKLIQSQEQVEFSKDSINQLVKTHTTELSQLTTQLQLVQRELAQQQELVQQQQQQMAQQQQHQAEREKLLHTPNGSPRIEPESEKHMNHLAPQLMSRTDSSDTFRTPKESMDQSDEDDLDDQLLRLTQTKEKLQSAYSKIPINGGSAQVRRRQEELEMMLDHVDSQLSKVKQKIRKT
ncbi:hypothetical protein BD560DRAFT_399256 [Blakeslea trispora]|nr:hypothetical protein BD560DRAFT_399256 [Blakeslea trispora]